MSKNRDYQVNGNPAPKDTSFRSFICALLVFLALCLAIYLLLALVINKESKEETGAFRNLKEDVEEVSEDGHKKSKNDKFTNVNASNKKEYEETTTARTSKNTMETITERTSTARISYEKTTTLGNDIDYIPGTGYRKEKVPIHTKGSFETTTNSVPVEDKDKSETNWRDQNTLDKSTEEVTQDTSTEFNVERRIDQSTNDRTSTAGILYETTTTVGNDIDYIPGTEFRTEKVPSFETTTNSSPVEDKDKGVINWRDTTTNEATTKFGDESSISYKDENIPSTTNIPHITNKDQDVLYMSTEGVTTDTFTEFIARGRISQTTDDSFTTDNSMYSFTTEKEITMNLGINDSLFYKDVYTEDTNIAEESTTTEILYLTAPTDAGQANQGSQYLPFSTTRNENESTEESTSENVLSIKKLSNLQSFTESSDSSTIRDTADRDNSVNTEDTTTEFKEKILQNGSDLSTTDIYGLIKNYYTEDTTRDVTTESEIISYNQKGTTDFFEIPNNYGSTTEVDLQQTASTTDWESTTITHQRNGKTIKDVTTSNYGFTTEGDLQEIASTVRWSATTTDDTTEDTTAVYKTIPPYNGKGTTDLNVPTSNYESTTSADLQEATHTYQAGNGQSIDLDTTEQWDSTTRTVNVLNTTYLETTTTLPLTRLIMKNSLTPHPVRIATPPPAPQACTYEICKKTSSKLLYLMNYNEDDICENFFDFACGGQKIDKDSAKRDNLKMLINYLDKINNSSGKYLIDFKRFYTSCVQHEQDFKFSQTRQSLLQIPKMDLTELFAELILTQSMPLFDIGIDISRDTQAYILEVTLPGSSSLTTKVQGWSLMEQIWKECLDAVKMSKSKRGSYINLHREYLSVKKCQSTRFENIAKNFVEEMTQFSGGTPIYSDVNLDNLLFLMKWIQDYSPKGYDIQQTLVDKDYGISSIAGLKNTFSYSAVDWNIVFDKITFRGPSDKNLLVYFRSHLEFLFKVLENNFSNSELFNTLWLYSRLQLYVNTGISKEREDREMYCMDLAKQVMPNTVSVIAYKEAGDQFAAIGRTSRVFHELKRKLTESILKSQLENTTKIMLKEKLKKAYLGIISTGDSSSAIANSQNVVIGEDDYQSNVVESLKNYRRIVYSLTGNQATPASLLRYFVDPFDTKPKLFEARNVIVAQTAFFESYSPLVPKYIRLATKGMHLSQELTKVVIDREAQDKQFYQDLVKSTNNLLLIYANHSYNIQGSRVSFNLSQNLWIKQMIVDNAAFKLTFDVFFDLATSNGLDSMPNLPWIANDYPINKTFFIAAAQEYCQEYTPMDFMQDIYITGDLPPPLRVQNFLSNSEKFATVFDCPVGTPMTVQKNITVQFPNIDYEYEDFDLSN